MNLPQQAKGFQSNLTWKQKQAKAQQMRDNPTLGEAALWTWLANKNFCGLKFDSQVIILGYIVDFICRSAKIVVEVDGSSHDGRAEYDANRTRALETLGLRVVRCTNREAINRPHVVLQRIADVADRPVELNRTPAALRKPKRQKKGKASRPTPRHSTPRPPAGQRTAKRQAWLSQGMPRPKASGDEAVVNHEKLPTILVYTPPPKKKKPRR